MADGNVDRDPAGNSGQAPGGGWKPVPDPTLLTTEAVERATQVFRREILALRETIETRLAGDDADRARLWERVRDLPQLYETAAGHLRDELVQRDAHNREVLTQRLNDLDTATRLAGEQLSHTTTDNDAQSAALARDFADSLRAEREFLLTQITAIDEKRAILENRFVAYRTEAQVDRDRELNAVRELIEARLDMVDTIIRTLTSEQAELPGRAELERNRMGDEITQRMVAEREYVMGQIELSRAATDKVSEVTLEKFEAVASTFASNALALTAALAAQKEAAAESNKSSALAISKSEAATQETIKSNAAQTQTGQQAISDILTDVKERVVRLESLGVGVRQATTEARADRGEGHNTLVAMIMAVSVLIAIVSFVAFTLKR